MGFNNSNYGFLLANNKYVKYLMIDGYEVGGLSLDGVMIKVALDSQRKAVAWFSEEDKKKFNLNPENYKEELNTAAEILKEAIENKYYGLFSFSREEVYDINKKQNFENKEYELITKYSLGNLNFFALNNEVNEKTSLIKGVYVININQCPQLKMTDFERTVESLNMINFVKDLSKIKVEILMK